MEGKTHKLKISPLYYEDVYRKTKTFEVRKNDRDFKVLDFLHLHKYIDGLMVEHEYLRAKISYILDDEEYCKKGYVIIGLNDVCKIVRGRF